MGKDWWGGDTRAQGMMVSEGLVSMVVGHGDKLKYGVAM